MPFSKSYYDFLQPQKEDKSMLFRKKLVFLVLILLDVHQTDRVGESIFRCASSEAIEVYGVIQCRLSSEKFEPEI